MLAWSGIWGSEAKDISSTGSKQQSCGSHDDNEISWPATYISISPQDIQTIWTAVQTSQCDQTYTQAQNHHANTPPHHISDSKQAHRTRPTLWQARILETSLMGGTDRQGPVQWKTTGGRMCPDDSAQMFAPAITPDHPLMYV